MPDVDVVSSNKLTLLLHPLPTPPTSPRFASFFDALDFFWLTASQLQMHLFAAFVFCFNYFRPHDFML